MTLFALVVIADFGMAAAEITGNKPVRKRDRYI